MQALLRANLLIVEKCIGWICKIMHFEIKTQLSYNLLYLFSLKVWKNSIKYTIVENSCNMKFV